MNINEKQIKYYNAISDIIQTALKVGDGAEIHQTMIVLTAMVVMSADDYEQSLAYTIAKLMEAVAECVNEGIVH
jgi:hypothetical protein